MSQTMTLSNALLRLFSAVLSEDTVLRKMILSFIADTSPSSYFALFQSETWNRFKDEHPNLADEIVVEFQKEI